MEYLQSQMILLTITNPVMWSCWLTYNKMVDTYKTNLQNSSVLNTCQLIQKQPLAKTNHKLVTTDNKTADGVDTVQFESSS